ncbi:glycine zipper 2TM domain-containing protein [Ramlibacter sp.]|uniref:glycine zipper 2TM domain-containing protein n=1 Tax=Ramlibacter sp. TaxID=1917967 RepID=UPI003D139D6D
MRFTRLAAAASGVAMLATVVGCATTSPYPVSTYPTYPTATYPSVATAPAMLEFGRVTNIEYLPVGTNSPLASSGGTNILGAVVGGLAGGALGNMVGGGSGRAAATVLGAVGGAMVGNRIARNQQGLTTAPGYRVTVQTDNGLMRMYEVGATGDLRVGDRVRVENNVIYRA